MSQAYAEVIGDPIAHSRSPAIHGFWLKHAGIDGDYRASHVRHDALAGYFAQRRADPMWRGCNVTIPHKQAVHPYLDRLDDKAANVGAVNTIWKGADGALTGTNTDVDGVAEAIAGYSAGAGHAVVIGAGGAARAAFACLADMGAGDCRVLARSPEKAMAAVGEFGLDASVMAFDEAAGALSGAALLINATQLGMTGQPTMPPSLLDALEGMAQGALVFDMVYAPLETPLLHTARERSLRTSDGLVMLVGQAAEAFERFFGAAPPRGMDGELRKILTS